MPQYSTILFDLDHTLLDSDRAERRAFVHALQSVELDESDEMFGIYHSINQALWRAVERHELSPNDVRQRRFEEFLTATGHDRDARVMTDAFVWGFAHFAELYPGARDVLNVLQGAAQLALVSNGIGEVQRTRLERLELEPMFDAILISGEVGTSKPGPRIFELAFTELGDPDPSTAVMVGDSLISDVRGAANFGIASCWYNPGRSVAGVDDVITHEIRRLDEILQLAPRSPNPSSTP